MTDTELREKAWAVANEIARNGILRQEAGATDLILAALREVAEEAAIQTAKGCEAIQRNFNTACDRLTESENRNALLKARLKLCDDGTPDARGKFRVIEAEAKLKDAEAKLAALEKKPVSEPPSCSCPIRGNGETSEDHRSGCKLYVWLLCHRTNKS